MNTSCGGLKEFVTGDILLYDANMLGEASFCHGEDFEEEFRRTLLGYQQEAHDAADTPESGGPLDPFTASTTLLEPGKGATRQSRKRAVSALALAPAPARERTSFEEDPLSQHLNKQQVPGQAGPSVKKRRGRPPLIQFQSIARSSSFESLCSLDSQSVQLRNRRFDGDLYSPLWVRARGPEREGCCPLCSPPVWFKIKQSAYWYHMNFFHGISAVTGQPYKRPITYRVVWDSQRERNRAEGHCASCLQWITLVVDFHGKEALDSDEVPLNSWFKHAQKCHHRYRELDIPTL